MAKWEVIENYFSKGKYQLGLILGSGSWTNEKYSSRINKKGKSSRTAVYDHFMDFVPEERKGEV